MNEADDLICHEPTCSNFQDPGDLFTCTEDHFRSPNGPMRDGKVWVLNSKCPTCIFRPGNKMHLTGGTLVSMVEKCITENRVIPCDETLAGPRSVCRGLWDVHRHEIGVLLLAEAMGVIEFDDLPEEP